MNNLNVRLLKLLFDDIWRSTLSVMVVDQLKKVSLLIENPCNPKNVLYCLNIEFISEYSNSEPIVLVIVARVIFPEMASICAG